MMVSMPVGRVSPLSLRLSPSSRETAPARGTWRLSRAQLLTMVKEFLGPGWHSPDGETSRPLHGSVEVDFLCRTGCTEQRGV